MNPPPKEGDLARGWLAAEKLATDEAERLAAAPDDEFDRAMDALPAPTRVPTVEDLMARAARRASTSARPPAPSGPLLKAPANRRRVRPLAASLIAFVVVVVCVGLAIERDAIVAWWNGDRGHIAPDRGPWPEPPPDRRAAQLRQQALAACEDRAWDLCRQGLDAARALDPAGEEDPRVTRARTALATEPFVDAAPLPLRPDKPPRRR